MIKCVGCGAILQDKDPLIEGFTRNMQNDFCERCFQIKHYNNYLPMQKDNADFLEIVSQINKTGDLVILVTDFLNFYNLKNLNIKNPVILVFTKRDLFPRSLDENKFLDKINLKLNVVNKMFVCSNNNYNLDLLYKTIMEYKVSNMVYVIGYTNAGKSTLINKMIYNYGNREGTITTSILPSTTLDLLENKVNDKLTLVDTPGLLDEGSIILKAGKDDLRKIVPKKQIRPLVYQIKVKQTLVVDKFFELIFSSNNNIVIYMSNTLEVKRFYKDKRNEAFKYKEIEILDNQDLVIKGLGFIKFKNKTKVVIGIIPGVSYFVRNSCV